jgi:hypothetical protein
MTCTKKTLNRVQEVQVDTPETNEERKSSRKEKSIQKNQRAMLKKTLNRNIHGRVSHLSNWEDKEPERTQWHIVPLTTWGWLAHTTPTQHGRALTSPKRTHTCQQPHARQKKTSNNSKKTRSHTKYMLRLQRNQTSKFESRLTNLPIETGEGKKLEKIISCIKKHYWKLCISHKIQKQRRKNSMQLLKK